jgi:hypothetical protein
MYVSPEDIREVLRLPDDFVCDDEDLGVTWGLGPTLQTRDSGFAAEANSEALLRFLNEHTEVDGDWYVMRARHWGCGWVEQLVFRVLDEKEGATVLKLEIEKAKEILELCRESGEVDGSHVREKIWELEERLEALRGPSKVFELLMEWKKGLEDDPIADHELYEEKRKEAALEDIRWAHRIRVKSKAPDTWVEEVFEKLDREDKIQEEPSGDLYIISDDINAALKELGYYDHEQD